METESVSDDVFAVTVSGEVDQATVDALRAALDEAIGGGSRSLLVDLTGLEFIDSSGLGALVSARERVIDQNGRLFGICCAEPQVRRMLEITGLDESMGLTETREEALAALGTGAAG